MTWSASFLAALKDNDVHLVLSGIWMSGMKGLGTGRGGPLDA